MVKRRFTMSATLITKSDALQKLCSLKDQGYSNFEIDIVVKSGYKMVSMKCCHGSDEVYVEELVPDEFVSSELFSLISIRRIIQRLEFRESFLARGSLFLPDKVMGICPICGKELYGRRQYNYTKKWETYCWSCRYFIHHESAEIATIMLEAGMMPKIGKGDINEK
jgi:hypothetical protein